MTIKPFSVIFDDKARRWLYELDVGDVTGRRILLDKRIILRMPHKIPVTVGGVGPLRGLHHDFSGEEWARLLYDTAPF